MRSGGLLPVGSGTAKGVEVCAESEDKLWEEAHMRCEAVCNEIKRDTGYEAIYQYTA